MILTGVIPIVEAIEGGFAERWNEHRFLCLFVRRTGCSSGGGVFLLMEKSLTVQGRKSPFILGQIFWSCVALLGSGASLRCIGVVKQKSGRSSTDYKYREGKV